MAYQLSWATWNQRYLCRRAVVKLIWLELELTYFDAALDRFSNYAMILIETYVLFILLCVTSRVIPKTLKMVLSTSLLNTQQYKVRI